MDDESKSPLQGDRSRSERQDSTEGVKEESPVDEVEVEVVSREMAPAHLKQLTDITDALITGKMPVKRALTTSDPALRASVEAFIDKYAFVTDDDTLEALRKAKIAEGLTSKDLVISLNSVRLAQKEAEISAAKPNNTGGLSNEVQEVIDRIKQEKLKQRKETEDA